MKKRIIFHIDVNNAFLSWSAVDRLQKGEKIDIRKRFAVIGGDESKRRGIVLAKSNLCKSKGVVTGEAIFSARRKCPYLEVYAPDFKIYRHYSNMMYEYLCSYTNLIERYSVDECFLDLSDSIHLYGDPIKLAYKIKDDIKGKFGFTVNVGIGNNKLCAKMASDFLKPDRVHTLWEDEIAKMWNLDVSELFMVGKSSCKKLRDMNILTIGDLAHCERDFLVRHFKKMGQMMWEYANGIDNSEVFYEEENPKSVSTSTVLPYNYSDREEIFKVLRYLSSETGKRLREKKLYASGVNIWIKYSNFTKVSKQMMLNNNIDTDEDIYRYATLLFQKLWNEENSIRGLCVGVNNTSDIHRVQLSLFENNKIVQREDDLQKTMDLIKEKFGDKSIIFADMMKMDIELKNKK